MMFFFYADDEVASKAGEYAPFFSHPTKLPLVKQKLVFASHAQKTYEKTIAQAIDDYLTTRKLSSVVVEQIVQSIWDDLIKKHKAGYTRVDDISMVSVHILIKKTREIDIDEFHSIVETLISRLHCDENRCPYFYHWCDMCGVSDESDMPCIYHDNIPPLNI